MLCPDRGGMGIRIIRGKSQIKSGDSISVTIGNFDGCHLGHQALMRSAVHQAQQLGISSAVMTFDPHPASYFEGVDRVTLYSQRQKERMISELGVDLYLEVPFDRTIAEMSPKSFVKDLLFRSLKCATVSVGDDFRFGADREGDIQFLRTAGAGCGINVHVEERITVDDAPISSSRIRKCLSVDGDVTKAARLLGRPFCIEGKVIRGQQLGRRLGLPTANIAGVAQLIPLPGVYGGYALFTNDQESPSSLMSKDSRMRLAVINVGFRPTIADSRKLVIEVHVPDGKFGENELYDKNAAILFVQRIRNEMKMASLEELKSVIQNDISCVMENSSSWGF